MLTFAEEIMLLLLDEERGDLASIEPDLLGMTLAGAVLMDLGVRAKIDTDLEHVVVVDAVPTGEPMLDEVLARLAVAEQNQSPEYWVGELAQRGADLERQALARLAERGVLEIQEKRVWGIFEFQKYVLREHPDERAVKQALRDVLASDDIPDPHDIVLVCLADGCGIFPLILSNREYRRAEARIAQVRKMDLIGQAVAKTIEALRLHLVRVVSRVPM